MVLDISALLAILQERTAAEGFSRCAGVRGLALVPVDVDQAHLARKAHRMFGKGVHPASLNFGDCFAYALAQTCGEPLLYKGEHFSLIDVIRHPVSGSPATAP